ncbi:MAG: threonine/serine exporter family protein [Bacteroidales bacterium]
MDYLVLSEKIIWFGLAAVGFAILFNVPSRALPSVFIMGATGGILKVLFMKWGVNIILASFIGATMIGIISVYAAHLKKGPPLIFSIPSVIPLVPGAFAYRMMLGLIKLSGQQTDKYAELLQDTVHYGLLTLFILICLAAGVSFPMLITRKDSIKK